MIILDDKALSILRNSIKENFEYYKNHSDSWLQYYSEIDLLGQYRANQDRVLVNSNDPLYDTENAIKIYENNKALSTTLASSDHYWTTLAHTTYYDYMKNRWPIFENSKTSYIAARYFFVSTNQKSRARHGLARLWWIAHLTYDDTNQKDPYYYTRIATRDQELYNLIMETKHVAQNKKALFAMLDTLSLVFKINEGEIKKFNKREFIRDMMKQINLIGTVTVWDLLSQEEAMWKLMIYVQSYLGINLRELKE